MELLDTPLVSIVIPIYNPQNYFSDCIYSILNQTYENFEVIISDDSTFESSILTIDKRIKYFKNDRKEKGIFSNLNSALRRVSGRFIQIFCQDDIMKPDFLQGQVRLLLNNLQADMVFSQFCIFINNEEKIGFTHSLPSILPKKHSLIYFFLFGCLPGNLSTVMVTSKIFKEVGLFNENYKYAGDFEFWIRIGRESDIIFNNKRDVVLRQHKKQASFTLDHAILLKDLVSIYGFLYKALPAGNKKTGWFYMNELIGVQHVRRIVVASRHSLKSLKNLKYLNSGPFNIFLITFLTLLTGGSSFKLFTSKKFINFVETNE